MISVLTMRNHHLNYKVTTFFRALRELSSQVHHVAESNPMEEASWSRGELYQ